MSDLINYFISNEGSLDNASLEFDKLVNYLSTLENFRVQIDNQKASLFCFESGKQSFLAFREKATSDSIFNNQIVYSCEQNDWQSTKSLNKAIKEYGYRLFNPALGFFLTNNENLTDLYNTIVEEKLKKIFRKFGLVPLFKYENSLVYYAQDIKNKSVNLVNRHLLEFLLSQEEIFGRKEDFSVKVADDIPRFIALFDRGLIPISFYKTASSKSNVINLSGIDLEETKEKIIVTPVFFEFVPSKQAFRNSPKTPFIKENLIPKGGSIKDYLKAINEGSFFKGKIISVKVGHDIAFETDRQKNPIPRITVSIFLDEQND
ncbi:MAG: hypothetical protein KatS3mg088_779 [Patescibacteria group bacterium]|nr:MAG: hypothetical protein KatS3mg088_779 [Patescibacteria group bacterium]